jgi:hypothetical protein
MEQAHPDRGSCDPYKHHLEPLVELRYLAEAGAPDGDAQLRGEA